MVEYQQVLEGNYVSDNEEGNYLEMRQDRHEDKLAIFEGGPAFIEED